MIHEPVTDCRIVFKYLHWTPDRKGKQYYQDRFETISELRNYFKRFPSAGALVGYGKAPTGGTFAFSASISVEGTADFQGVKGIFHRARVCHILKGKRSFSEMSAV